MNLRILAVDPGSIRHAVVVLNCDASQRVSYGGGAIYDLESVQLGEPAIASIIETIEGYAFKGGAARVKDMVLTARNEGRIIERIIRARGPFPPPMTCSAGEARGALCRSGNASDAQVAIVVEALVHGAPKEMRKVDRQHIYDACLYGLYGLTKLGIALRLPPAAEAALHVQRERERAAASAKGKATKARRQMGAFR